MLNGLRLPLKTHQLPFLPGIAGPQAAGRGLIAHNGIPAFEAMTICQSDVRFCEDDGFSTYP